MNRRWRGTLFALGLAAITLAGGCFVDDLLGRTKAVGEPFYWDDQQKQRLADDYRLPAEPEPAPRDTSLDRPPPPPGARTKEESAATAIPRGE